MSIEESHIQIHYSHVQGPKSTEPDSPGEWVRPTWLSVPRCSCYPGANFSGLQFPPLWSGNHKGLFCKRQTQQQKTHQSLECTEHAHSSRHNYYWGCWDIRDNAGFWGHNPSTGTIATVNQKLISESWNGKNKMKMEGLYNMCPVGIANNKWLQWMEIRCQQCLPWENDLELSFTLWHISITCKVPGTPATQSVFLGPAALTPPGACYKCKILGPIVAGSPIPTRPIWISARSSGKWYVCFSFINTGNKHRTQSLSMASVYGNWVGTEPPNSTPRGCAPGPHINRWSAFPLP